MWINRNMTSIILGIIYAVVAYLIMRFGVSDEISLGMYAIVITGGVIIILILFNYILKYDFFKNNKGE